MSSNHTQPMKFSAPVFSKFSFHLNPCWTELPLAYSPHASEKESPACISEVLRRKLNPERVSGLLMVY